MVLLMFTMMTNTVSLVPEPVGGSHIAAVPHDPIVIIGDANFSDTASAEGWSGDGSLGSPYIIENLEITLGPSPTAAIRITDTRMHFIIRECYLTGPLATPSYGVHLENVANGRIDDTLCSGFSTGINITGCNGITVYNNNCSDNSYGIHIESSNSSKVINNICSNTFLLGIRLLSSNSSIVSGNTCNDGDGNGIYLYNCNSSIANDNVCNNNNYGLFLHTCNSSTVNRNICNENSFSGIYLLRSHFSSAANNTCDNNREGMYIQEMDSNNVTGNTCFNNTLRGIALQQCDFNTLTFNTVTNTSIEHGLRLTGPSNSNNFSWNVFAYSASLNGFDTGGVNNLFENNYWSDYGGVDADSDGIGDTAYTVGGVTDSNPLMYHPWAPEWVQELTDQVNELGTSFEYAFEFIFITSTAPYDLSINDDDNFVVSDLSAADSNTRRHAVSNWRTLAVGIYPLVITATNIYGFITEGAFTLAVVDTTPPLITSPEDISYTKGESPPEITWVMSDLSLIGYTVLLDGAELTSSNGVTSTSAQFGMILEDKDPGIYNYTMVAEDEYGNVAMDTVIVTVHPVPLLEALLPLLLVGVVAIVVVVVAVVAFRKRKVS
jgi:parallel beta-helix repeat protein